jgi:hypothetical protein
MLRCQFCGGCKLNPFAVRCRACERMSKVEVPNLLVDVSAPLLYDKPARNRGNFSLVEDADPHTAVFDAAWDRMEEELGTHW